jgi:hypothetical protein
MDTTAPKRRRKRRSWWILTLLVLIFLLGLAMGLPSSPIYLAKWLEPDVVQDGRKRSEWQVMLDSPDKQQRVEAASALGKLNTSGRKALSQLLRAMQSDPEADVRAAACDAVSKMYPADEPDAAKEKFAKTVLPPLIEGLTDSDKRVRHNAAVGLLKLKRLARPAVPALLKAGQDLDNDTDLNLYHTTVRQVILRALAEAAVGTADAVPTFTAILEEKVDPPPLPGGGRRPMGRVSEEVAEASRKYIQAAINRRIAVGGLGLAGEHGRATAPKIRELLKSTDPDDRFVATEALQRMGLPIEGN